MRSAKTDKLIVLGVDGMDPRFASKMLSEKRMPNLQKIIDRGSCREDLRLLGAMPPITPPDRHNCKHYKRNDNQFQPHYFNEVG